MEELRPDSTALLQQITQQENAPAGKLKIFFGYAAGVGKTYAMLEAAQRFKEAGGDVVAGYIEPHTRPETMELLAELEQLPPKELHYKGIWLREFDLDAALKRKPELILVDELAHTNAEGCRHIKRYQDVEELLRAGINVYTTVNVQHLESINDVVAAITGITVSERIPDHIFDAADQVELMDIEPADLLERLKAGKIYRERQADQAMSHFFSEKNLAALREIALRRTADRVSRAPVHLTEPRSKSGEHVLICLSSSPSNTKVIRTAARMAEAFHGEFTALFVETSDFSAQSDEERKHLLANLRLAEELGARITTVYGDDPAIQIAEYARIGGISKIVLGRSQQKRPFYPVKKTLMDRLLELAPDLDIYIIPEHTDSTRSLKPRRIPAKHLSIADFVKMSVILLLCTAVGVLLTWMNFNIANVILMYILGVLFISMITSGRLCSLLASFLSVLVFNFFFTYPYFTLNSDPSYIATFIVMFLVSLLSSSLTTRSKAQAISSARKAYRTEVLLETSQKLQKAEDIESIIKVTATQLNKLLDHSVLFYAVDSDDKLQEAKQFPVHPEDDLSGCLTPAEQAAAEWVRKNNKHAGVTTGTLPGAKCLYMAVRGMAKVFAVVGIVIDGTSAPDAFEKNLMIAILDECGLAMEKESIGQAKRKIEETARQEALRASLLRAISHDLRTPLTSISGNAGILMENGSVLDEDKKHKLYSSIYDDSIWLIRLVENLLSITRIENGSVKLKTEPELLDEIFQEALAHLDRSSVDHEITVDLPDDLMMANMDAQLIVQVIINLINNAIKYTQPGSHITLSARRCGKLVNVTVSDDGPGISDAAKEKLFDMFFTADNVRGDGRRGLGLGLSLCKSIINAHGGVIEVADNTPKGTRFQFTLHTSEVNAHE